MRKNRKVAPRRDYAALLTIAMDLHAAITDAHWEGKLTHPTLHMDKACYDLKHWIEEAKIPCLIYPR